MGWNTGEDTDDECPAPGGSGTGPPISVPPLGHPAGLASGPHAKNDTIPVGGAPPPETVAESVVSRPFLTSGLAGALVVVELDRLGETAAVSTALDEAAPAFCTSGDR
jgi:hypothetical protein